MLQCLAKFRKMLREGNGCVNVHIVNISIHKVQTFQDGPDIIRRNVAGAVFKPNGMTRNSYNPFAVINADYSIADSSSGICQ